MENFNPQNIINQRASEGRGKFEYVAELAVSIKKNIEYLSYCTHLSHVEQEALDQIASKIARICCRKGDYDLDSWQDIAGYATLVVSQINKEIKGGEDNE